MKRYMLTIMSLFILNNLSAGERIDVDVGFVSSVKGIVFMDRADNKFILSGMELIKEGDIIHLNKDSSIKINICETGLFEIKGEAVINIKDKSPLFKKGKENNKKDINREECQKILETIKDFSGNLRKLQIKEDKSLRDKSELSDGSLIIRSQSPGEIKIEVSKVLIRGFNIIIPKINSASKYQYIIRDSKKNIIYSGYSQKNTFGIENVDNKFDRGANYILEIAAIDDKNKVIAQGYKEFIVCDNKEEERFYEEIESINKNIKNSPEDEPLLIMLGNLYESLNLFDKAIEAYNKALKINGNNKGLKMKVRYLSGE